MKEKQLALLPDANDVHTVGGHFHASGHIILYTISLTIEVLLQQFYIKIIRNINGQVFFSAIILSPISISFHSEFMAIDIHLDDILKSL